MIFLGIRDPGRSIGHVGSVGEVAHQKTFGDIASASLSSECASHPIQERQSESDAAAFEHVTSIQMPGFLFHQLLGGWLQENRVETDLLDHVLERILLLREIL